MLMQSEVVRRSVVIGLTALSVAFGLSPGFGQVALDLEAHQDFISSLSSPDPGSLIAGPASPTGIGRPPRVGPNVRVNAAQQPSPNGLLGRSETSIAATDDGIFLVAGFNDAQGFCGAPFGAPCIPQTPPGLSGYAFSTDGGLTWTDGGAPDPGISDNVSDVFTRGDPWLDRGGFDNQTFYFANLAVHAVTGAGLGVGVHRGHFNPAGILTWHDVRVFNAPNAPHDLYDKEALAAAKDGSGKAY